jgi:hypothetical protein
VHRPTRDLDLLGSGNPDPESLRVIFHDLASPKRDDEGLAFLPDTISVNPIREEQEYGGQRVTLTVKLGNARLALQIDIGFGDAVTPAAVITELPTLLAMPAPNLRVYPKETVVAEKCQAMVVLGMANSRMKDFFDLWVGFSGQTLRDALRATFRRRKTELPANVPVALAHEFADDAKKQTQWKAFVAKADLSAKAAPFPDVLALLRTFLLPPLHAATADIEFHSHWSPPGPWRPNT